MLKKTQDDVKYHHYGVVNQTGNEKSSHNVHESKGVFSGACWYCGDKGHQRAQCKPWIFAGRPSTKTIGDINMVAMNDPMVSNTKKLEHNVGLACSEYTPVMSQGRI